ncbi:MAG: hypothetical protein E7032_09715 [Akkermansiaceae bacterium]|nr:hypothetical protein [Akkermansiaceae bacterium]
MKSPDPRDFGLSPRLSELVQHDLRPGEQLRWVGRPALFWSLDWGIVIGLAPFLAVFGGLGGYVLYSLVTGEIEVSGFTFLIVLGLSLLFVLFPLAAMLSPFFRAWRLQNTFYVITNHRAFISGMGEGSWRLQNDMVASNFQRKDGSGNLVFSVRWETDANGVTRKVENGFMNIRDVRLVEEILEKAIAERMNA